MSIKSFKAIPTWSEIYNIFSTQYVSMIMNIRCLSLQ